MIFQKSRFRRVQTHISNFVVSGLEFTEILAGHERNRCRSHVSPTLDPLGIYLGQNSKVGPKSLQIMHVLPQNYL